MAWFRRGSPDEKKPLQTGRTPGRSFRKPVAGTGRTVYANNRVRNQTGKFCNNHVSTGRYTVVTFLFKNLIEQFSRAANFYFLCISIIQLIPDASPTGSFTTLGPLSIVLLVTAIKDAYEDIRRHRADDEVNNSLAEVFRDGKFTKIKWRDVDVGDIVRVRDKQYFPADLVLLNSSEPQGACYIETSSLDGETNLKIRQALADTSAICTIQNLSIFDGVVVCEEPNNRLYRFEGSIEVASCRYPLSSDQLLLRGAQLRNTGMIIGLVIYTGHETKLMMNASKPPHKVSTIERTTNKLILFIFCFEMFIAIISAIFAGVFFHNHSSDWYLYFKFDSAINTGLFSILTFIVLYNNVIPISLYVSMEMVKVFQAYLMNNDIQMYDAATDTPAQVRSSSLNEELGQIQYLLSDKTGTLTCNQMNFKRCSIYMQTYGTFNASSGPPSPEKSAASTPIRNPLLNVRSHDDSVESISDAKKIEEQMQSVFQDPLLDNGGWKRQPNAEQIREYFTILAVCHTVIPERTQGSEPNARPAPENTVFQASSPDEGALVAAAKDIGFFFHSRTQKSVTIRVDGRDRLFEVLNTLEFSSDRKRMSVIVRVDGRIFLYTKGADSTIFPLLRTDEQHSALRTYTEKQLTEFAAQGLRTLVVAKAEIDPATYQSWNTRFQQARVDLVNRKEKTEAVSAEIERNLQLVGTTAIEDKLQDEVPGTIELLHDADIKVWVLTGDKVETAINIGFSSSLLTSQMKVLQLTGDDVGDITEHMTRIRDDANREMQAGSTLAFVIDGHALTYALDENNKMMFLYVASLCKSVICCRVSPLQKAMVVRLVKENLRARTLAIGDGANDVSMIQAADVGVGISGVEGLQAARSADFSISQFRFLQRLLLVHGRWNYRRVSKLVAYSFYKNIMLYITQFWFVFFNGFSGQTLYDRWAIAAYNVVFTALPVIIMAIFDQDVPDHVSVSFPQLYVLSQRGYYFSVRVFLEWFSNSLIHSLICFFVPLGTFWFGNHFSDGQTSGMVSVGVVSFTSIIFVVNMKIGLETSTWNWIFQVFLYASLASWFVFLFVWSNLFPAIPNDTFSFMYGVPARLVSSPLFYLVILMSAVLCMGRDFLWKFYKRSYGRRNLTHILQNLRAEKSPFTQDVIGRGERNVILDRVGHVVPPDQKQERRHMKLFSSMENYTGYNFTQAERDEDRRDRDRRMLSKLPPNRRITLGSTLSVDSARRDRTETGSVRVSEPVPFNASTGNTDSPLRNAASPDIAPFRQEVSSENPLSTRYTSNPLHRPNV